MSSISAPQLRRLDLSNNQLSRLDAGMLADWYQLRHLNLVGNRWRCNDCAMADFLPGVLRRLVNSRNFSNNGNQDVVSDVVVVVVENEARCTQPEWLFNTRIVELVSNFWNRNLIFCGKLLNFVENYFGGMRRWIRIFLKILSFIRFSKGIVRNPCLESLVIYSTRKKVSVNLCFWCSMRCISVLLMNISLFFVFY